MCVGCVLCTYHFEVNSLVRSFHSPFFPRYFYEWENWGVETGNGSILMVWNNNNATHLNPEEPFSYKVHKSEALNWLLPVVCTVEHHFLITVVDLSMQTTTTSSSSVLKSICSDQLGHFFMCSSVLLS